MNAPIVGIDLGTTFSLIGFMREGKPRLVRSATGDVLHPSAVFRDVDGTLYVGAAARHRAVLAPEQAALHFKRDMGTGRTVWLGRDYPPEELSALVLRSLKDAAEAELGLSVSKAVISVPAYFGESQRQATRTAAEVAGLEVVRLINEPTAAAIAYGITRTDHDLRVAVLDLGGGTFDVTLLEMIEGVIEIRSSSGDLFLGGIDFDRALVPWIRQQSLDRGHVWAEDENTNARLLEAAERAKKALSSKDVVDIVLAEMPLRSGRTASLVITLTRTQAELCWQPLTERLTRPVRRAFADAGWPPQKVDEVILVGGSSRLPLMNKLFTEWFSRPPLMPLPPDEAVALGAVLTAGLMENNEALQELVVTDIAPFSMGTALGHREGDLVVTGIYRPIIERGTVIPCSRRVTLSTLDERQTSVELYVYQGEHALAEKNTLLGKLRVKNIPPSEPHVEVRYTYDLNGLLEVEATVLATGAKVTTLIEHGMQNLDPAAKAKAQADLQKYKVPPDQKLENLAVLSQAEVLYQNVLGNERSELSRLILAFRMALETQDDGLVSAARERLRELVDEIW